METPTHAALANTLHQFKQPGLTPAGWAMVGSVPLLFALDRELGFKDGHIYDERAIQDLEAQRQMQVASASGGGGGSSDSGWSPTGSGGSDTGVVMLAAAGAAAVAGLCGS